MAISYTQADLDRLKEALLTGAKSVSIGDRRIDYNSPAELKQLITDIETQLSAASNALATTSPKVIGVKFKKGMS